MDFACRTVAPRERRNAASALFERALFQPSCSPRRSYVDHSSVTAGRTEAEARESLQLFEALREHEGRLRRHAREEVRTAEGRVERLVAGEAAGDEGPRPPLGPRPIACGPRRARSPRPGCALSLWLLVLRAAASPAAAAAAGARRRRSSPAPCAPTSWSSAFGSAAVLDRVLAARHVDDGQPFCGRVVAGGHVRPRASGACPTATALSISCVSTAPCARGGGRHERRLLPARHREPGGVGARLASDAGCADRRCSRPGRARSGTLRREPGRTRAVQ